LGPLTGGSCVERVELRGFEPLAPSMRTLGSEVVRGRWGRSAIGRRQTKSLIADEVAVLVCCTPLGVAVMRQVRGRGWEAWAADGPWWAPAAAWSRVRTRREAWTAAGSSVS